MVSKTTSAKDRDRRYSHCCCWVASPISTPISSTNIQAYTFCFLNFYTCYFLSLEKCGFIHGLPRALNQTPGLFVQIMLVWTIIQLPTTAQMWTQSVQSWVFFLAAQSKRTFPSLPTCLASSWQYTKFSCLAPSVPKRHEGHGGTVGSITCKISFVAHQTWTWSLVTWHQETVLFLSLPPS